MTSKLHDFLWSCFFWSLQDPNCSTWNPVSSASLIIAEKSWPCAWSMHCISNHKHTQVTLPTFEPINLVLESCHYCMLLECMLRKATSSTLGTSVASVHKHVYVTIAADSFWLDLKQQRVTLYSCAWVSHRRYEWPENLKTAANPFKIFFYIEFVQTPPQKNTATYITCPTLY